MKDSVTGSEGYRDAIIVDPGDESQAILERIRHHKLNVKLLWHTHAHIDHVGATKELLEILSSENMERGQAAPQVFLHEADRWLYENIALQAQFLGLRPFEVPSAFEAIKDGQSYPSFSGIKALHTPGHTPGSCCLELSESMHIDVPRALGKFSSQEAPRALFSGDTLFRRSIGRTDLWGGDAAKIASSIRNRLYRLNEESTVIPGHGPLTTIAEEKAKNPFVSAQV